jgi:predicted RNA binding protein YcfA (HicA-like mRNA interferase family)
VPKLGVFSGEEICRILETEGFLRVRQKGSHTILQKRTEQTTITVPVSDAPNDSNRYSSVDHSPISSTSRALPCVGCTERSARTSSHCRFAGEGVVPFRPAPSVSEFQPPLRSRLGLDSFPGRRWNGTDRLAMHRAPRPGLSFA